jgi:TolB protein
MSRSRHLIGAAALVGSVALALSLSPSSTHAQDAPSSEDSVLGTIDVDGSSGALPPLPKLAIAPLLTHGEPDEIVQLVARGDFSLSGQFEVLDRDDAPDGPFLVDLPLDLAAWRSAGVEYVLRVYSQHVDAGSGRMVGEIYLTRSAPSHRTSIDAGAPPAPKPAFQTSIPFNGELRMASHRLVDVLLGALTGRPGGFASRMVYTANVGNARQVFVLDSDGFALHAASPPLATAMSPAFGPGDVLYYALSVDLSPFRLASTPSGVLAPFQVPGSLMGLAFSADRRTALLVAMDDGESTIYLESGGKTHPYARAPLANHPVFGPGGKIAYVAGSSVQRVYVDRHAISPPGFMASAPVFCEPPQGLMIFYTVKTRAGSDIVASYTNGQGLRRFTQRQGANWDPACSPDGRLLAYFSTREPGRGAGLYVASIARPWLAKKVLGQTGDSLRWGAVLGAEPK